MNAVPQPLYEQVKDHVLRRIRSGEWRAGARVPSEHELVRALGVSRMTANRALRELTRAGILVRVSGVGTFVADLRAAGHPLQIRNIAAEIAERGHVHRAEVRALERVPVSEQIQARLALGARTQHVFHSLIVHLEQDRPLQVEDRWVNPALAPGYLDTDFTRTTPYEYLMDAAPLQRVEHIVRAVTPTAPIREMLALAHDEPALLVERLTYSGGARASYALLYHPGTRFELRGSFDL